MVASIADQAVIRVAAASDGAVYLGTYAPSNGRLFKFANGSLTDLGQPMTGESYVRSLAVDSNAVWVSNYRSAAAKLVRVDRSSGAKTAIATPAAFSSQWSAFDMTRAGDYLFLRTVNEPRLFAYDTVAGTFRVLRRPGRPGPLDSRDPQRRALHRRHLALRHLPAHRRQVRLLPAGRRGHHARGPHGWSQDDPCRQVERYRQHQPVAVVLRPGTGVLRVADRGCGEVRQLPRSRRPSTPRSTSTVPARVPRPS